jgi:hypothetical protein
MMVKEAIFKEYLKIDKEDGNTIKLDLHMYPWEVVGEVVELSEDSFSLTNTGSGTKRFNIKDIKHYRLA